MPKRQGRIPFRYGSAYAFLAILVTATPIHTAWAGQADVSGVGINNFGRINENYYRGAQPDLHGFMELKKLGVRSVIDLQEDGKPWEPEQVRLAGMQYFNIPLSSTKAATAAQLEYFLKLVNDPGNWPVYVHCAGGRHRTGEMTAVYRISHDSWTADEAYKEMKQYDYYSFGGHGPLKDSVYQYYGTFLAKAAASKPGTPAPTISK